MLCIALTVLLTTTPTDPVKRLPSLAAAIAAAKGTAKIVIYSQDVASVRNNLVWLEVERQLWAAPALEIVLADVLLVAHDTRHKEVRAFGLQGPGFTVLAPDGKQVLEQIDILEQELPQVISKLSRALGRPVPTTGMPGIPDPGKMTRALLRFHQYLKQGKLKRSEQFCAELAEADPAHSWVPRLRRQIRERRDRDAWLEKLPKSRAIENRIVVVPNRETFLEVIARWGNGPMFPILFHDAHYLPKFAQAFDAADIVYIPKAKPRTIDTALVATVWARAVGLRTRVEDARAGLAAWRKLKHRAPGVVVTHPGSDMLCAGIALAAGHRQGLVFAQPAAKPSTLIGMAKLGAWQQQIRAPLTGVGLQAFDLYDEIDFVTLALETPYRYSDPLAVDKSHYAVDDALCRDAHDLRWAYTGRLVGSTVQTTYQAMCALFLRPKHTLLWSSYGDGDLADYGIEAAADILRERHTVTAIDHPDASLTRWHTLQKNGNQFDYVHMHSSGGWYDWSTSGAKGSFDDVPRSVPSIITMTHSTSLGDPNYINTIAGRWLHHGAYAFFGSIHKPYLDAFVPIGEAVDRMLEAHEPLGSAHRRKIGTPGWRAWKLMLVGDPLLRFDTTSQPRTQKTKRLAKVVPLAQAARRNPWRLKTADKQLFAWQCQLVIAQLAAKPKKLNAIERGVTALLTKMDKRPKSYHIPYKTSLAECLAALIRQDASIESISAWAATETFRKLANPALDLALHGHCRHRLLDLHGRQADSEELEQIALLHASRSWHKRQLSVIQKLWTDCLSEQQDGKAKKKQLRTAIEKAIGKDAASILD